MRGAQHETNFNLDAPLYTLLLDEAAIFAAQGCPNRENGAQADSVVNKDQIPIA
jgi:hypothetical protein